MKIFKNSSNSVDLSFIKWCNNSQAAKQPATSGSGKQINMENNVNILAERQTPATPVITPRPAVKFCNQCGKVFAVAHADCRGHVPPEFAAPRCPQGHTEYWHAAGAGLLLVCHLDIDLGMPATEIDPAEPASATLFAAYLNGANVLDLLSDDRIKLIEEEALIEVQS